MAGIGPTLKSGNDVVLRGKIVYDFAFSFVAPLQAKYYVNHISVIGDFVSGGKNRRYVDT
jgi:hypothetical protein